MSAALLERARSSPDWASSTGLYANLSKWPHSVEYYVKCPKCSQVHGSYETMKEAHDQRLCAVCNLEAIDKIKDQVRQVVAEPERKVRTLASIMRESEFDKLPPVGPLRVPVEETLDDPAPEDELFHGQDPMAEIDRMLFSVWTIVAMRDLANYLNVSIEDIERKNYGGNYDEDEPNNTTYFSVSVGTDDWMLFKDEDAAIGYAEESVRNDLEHEPGIFSQSWLADFIDDDKLARAIGDPYADHGEEERGLDYTEQLQRMVEEDEIDDGDPVFFKLNGEPRSANKARTSQLEAILEAWIEKSKPEFDPWEWLNDCFGKEKATEEALKLVSIDVNKAAEDAIRADGWQHFVARYDGNSIDLKGGAVAVRT